MMTREIPKKDVAKGKATYQSQPLRGETKDPSMPGAFASDQFHWILTSKIGDGISDSKDDDILSPDGLSGAESHMRQIGELESGQSAMVDEDGSGAVENEPSVQDSPDLDHLQRLRALEEAILR